jgi:hypothetical protein
VADLVAATVGVQVRIRMQRPDQEEPDETVVTLARGHIEIQVDPGEVVRRQLGPGGSGWGGAGLLSVGPPRLTLTITADADGPDDASWEDIPWAAGLEWSRVAALLQAAALFDAGHRVLADELASVALMWPADEDQRAKARAALDQLRAKGPGRRGG